MSSSGFARRSLLSAAVSLLALSTPVSSSQRVSRDITCEDVHIFLGRGGNEAYPGRQGVLVDDICAGQTSCGYEDILFDATIGLPYATTMAQGATSGVLQVTNYANACPDAKLVLSGYSLGAGVVGDLLAGGDAGDEVYGTTEENTTGIVSATSSPGNQIAAVLLFGDTRHVASQSYNVLSGADANSYYPRPEANLANLNNFASVLRSYCDVADPVCASGDDVSVHLSYFELYSVAAAAWVRAQVGISGTATTTATVASDVPATAAAAGETITGVSSSATAVKTSTVSGAVTTSVSSSVSSSVSNGTKVTSSTATGTGTTSATGTATAVGESASATSGAESLQSRAGLVALGMLAAWVGL